MVQHADRPNGLRETKTGIAALDSAGLIFEEGGLYTLLGGPRSGRTALLLELAVRHAELDDRNSVLLLTEHGAVSAARRLLKREFFRIRAASVKSDSGPLLHPHHRRQAAMDRIEALICDRQIQVYDVLPGSAGVRFTAALWDDPPLRPPTLIVVDGYHVARTPLDVIRDLALNQRLQATSAHGTIPPIIVGAAVRLKQDKASKWWPGLSAWEERKLLDRACTILMLQRVSATRREVHVHMVWTWPEDKQISVRLEVDSSGSISTP